MVQAPGAKMLKVVGIIMVVFGGMGVIFIPIIFLMFYFMAPIFSEVGVDFYSDAFMASLIVGVAGPLFNVFAGIMAIKYNARLDKAQLLRLLGIIGIVVVVISTVFAYILMSSMMPFDTGISAAVEPPISLVLPILYLVGAIQNIKAARR